MIHRLLITLLLLTASLVNAQTTGSLAYDVFNGTTFDQRTLAPVEGKVLGWSGGLLTNITASGGTWGSITGTLASQTDLQSALDAKVENGASPTFEEVTLTNGIINSQAGNLNYNFYDVVDSSASPFIAVRLYDDQDPPQEIGSSLFGFRGDGAGSGYQFFQGSTNNFTFEGVGNVGLATVTANSFIGSGASLTSLNAGNITSGTLGVANGGTGATTLTANAVLLGNGTSALQTVAPGTNGNVLTSNGTTWTSAAPAAGAIRGYKRATYTSTASGTTTCSVITSTTLRAMTEGDQYMTITYTPTNAASRLVVRVRFMAGCSSVAWGGLLLARSGDANARVQCTGDNGVVINNTSSVSSHTLILDEVAGGTSAITYNVRFGGNAAGTFYMNRASGGVYPAGTESSIEVTEYAP